MGHYSIYVEGPKDTEGHANKAVEAGVAIQPVAIPARDVDETPRTTEMSPAPWWKSSRAIRTFVLSAAVGLAAGAYWLWPRQPTVPDLTGTTLSDAAAKLEAATLVVGRTTYQQDTEKNPGTVLSQSPSPNARVRSGTAVDIVLVQRPALVEVPVLTGKSLDAAQRVLRDLHLAVGNISREPKSHIAQNTVLDEFPKPGKKVDLGTAIDLVVSEALSEPAPAPSQGIKQFNLDAEFGAREAIQFRVTQPGKIVLEAKWEGGTPELALILNGPGKVGAYARKDGPNPLRLEYQLTSQDFAKGDEWRASVVNFSKVGRAQGTLTVITSAF